MDYPSYIVNTLSVSIGKIAPILLTIGAGYLLFIKLPFFIFLKVLKSSHAPVAEFQTNVTDLGDFRSQVEDKKRIEAERIRIQKEKIKFNQDYKFQYKEQKKKEAPKKPDPIPQSKANAAERIFNLEAGATISKSELKKKYHNLLKTSHPDKVSFELKSEAEARTKEINSAYQKLKSRAA